jgi:hypothetical protein
MKTYSNPRLLARIDNWPMGGARDNRGTAIFTVESDPKKGERAIRRTIDSKGHNGKPKLLTYAHKVRIVDGDDGKTYIAELTRYGFITIMRGDCRYEEEVIHSDNPRHSQVLALFEVPL